MGQATELDEHGGHEHPPYLQHHFDTPLQQFDSSKLGMWLFLATEILLFGGLFVAYAVYRANHPEVFVWAHQFLDSSLGATNTVILLCSSLTMAWAVRASQLGQQRLLVIMLCLTLLGGFGFMGIKFVEYKAKFEHGLLWAGRYQSQSHGAGHAAEEGQAGEAGHAKDPAHAEAPVQAAATAEPAPTDGSLVLERSTAPAPGIAPGGMVVPGATLGIDQHGEEPKNVQLFFSIYFLMTGLHGIHVLAGMICIAWILIKALGGAFSPAYFTPVDLVGLYWHLVDLIWIFLFPLLYLIH